MRRKRSGRGLLLDLQEPKLGVVLFGTFEVPGVAGEKDRGHSALAEFAVALVATLPTGERVTTHEQLIVGG